MIAKLLQDFIHIGIFTVIASIVQLSFHVEGNVSPGQECGKPPRGKIHALDNGTYRCCIEVTCPSGYIPTLCEKYKTEAICEECPGGHYSRGGKSSSMYKCKQHARCDSNRNLVVGTNGTSTSDAICECFLEGGYFRNQTEFRGRQPSHDYPCTSYKECPAGEELNRTGFCNKCASYWMFKDYAGVGSCKEKRDCGDLGLEYNSNQDTRTDNVCKNKTLEVSEHHQNNPVLGSLIPIVVASVIGIVLIAIIIVVVLCRRKRWNGNNNRPEPAKPPQPEDSDTDSGHHSTIVDYSRQLSTDSFTEEKQLLSNGHFPVVKTPPERPHISLPGKTALSDRNPGVITPDSAFCDVPQSLYCHDLVTDSVPNDQPASPDSQYSSTTPDINGKQGTIQVVVTGSHCNVHVGDKVVKNIYNSSEDLDAEEDGNVDYSVTEQPCY